MWGIQQNQETRAFQACLGLSPKADFRIGLSATPINNSLNDLVSELNILLPQFEWLALQSAVEEVWSFEPDKLNLPFVTRFTKNKLGIQFARRIVTSHLTKYQTDYVERVKSFIKNISRNRNRRGTFFEEISYFRMAASSPYTFFRALGSSEWKKYPNPKLTILKNIISSAQLSHWLIFCEFEDTIFHLEQNLTNLNCFTLTGKTPMSERPAIIESFRKTPNSVMMMTSVGSEGLDLQFCNGIINYDIHWNPMRLEQRFGRIDRVGQKKAEVIAHNIIVQGSLDERVVRVILRKLNMIHDSIFVPDSILGELPPLEKSQGLFNEDTLSKELGTSKKFLTMLQSNEDFQSYDYDILSLINSDYCSPSVLNVSATEWPKHTKWLLDKPVSSDWINKLKRYSMEFEKIIKYYS
jgi:SNF2 family DNA or RNA helicase